MDCVVRMGEEWGKLDYETKLGKREVGGKSRWKKFESDSFAFLYPFVWAKQ